MPFEAFLSSVREKEKGKKKKKKNAQSTIGGLHLWWAKVRGKKWCLFASISFPLNMH